MRLFRELEVGTEIIILKETYGWGGARMGDKGIVASFTSIDFPNHDGWSIDSMTKEGEHFTVINRDFIKF